MDTIPGLVIHLGPGVNIQIPCVENHLPIGLSVVDDFNRFDSSKVLEIILEEPLVGVLGPADKQLPAFFVTHFIAEINDFGRSTIYAVYFFYSGLFLK